LVARKKMKNTIKRGEKLFSIDVKGREERDGGRLAGRIQLI